MNACYQSKIRNSILEFYKANGLDKTLIFCNKLLESNRHKSDLDFRAKVHGEVCESYLECALNHYIAKHRLSNWFYVKGMVVRDVKNPKHRTELDLTLFTPARVILFECKSYSRDKKIVGQCTIQTSTGISYDVFKQQQNHLRTLNTNISVCYRGVKSGGYTLTLFDLSKGMTIDCREVRWRSAMPLLSADNLFEFLDSYRNRVDCWDMQRVRSIVDRIMTHNEKSRSYHLKYVQSLK